MRAARGVSSYMLTVTKISEVMLLIFNGLILKIHNNHLGYLPTTLMCFQAVTECNG